MPLVPGMPQWMGWLYGAIAGVAAVTDYRNGKIYNWLTLPALAVGLAVAGRRLAGRPRLHRSRASGSRRLFSCRSISERSLAAETPSS